jgi:biopolymer transport protein ExbD
MGGVNVDSGGKGGRRSLDSEINMIPMIDFLMVTISFLLLTAVWTHMARLNADAQVPGPPRPTEDIQNIPPEKQLHIEMRSPEKFVLIWKQAGTVISTIDVPRKDIISMEGSTRVVRFPDLAAKISSEWTTVGTHRDASDKKFDQAILHTDNETPYGAIIGVIDAVYQIHRPFQTGSKLDSVPAFNMTFSVN